MPDLVVRDVLGISPTTCVVCGTFETPMLDTLHDVPGYGRVYICVGNEAKPGCLLQAARAAGCADPTLRADLERRIGELATEVSELRQKTDLSLVYEAMGEALRANGDAAEAPVMSTRARGRPRTRAKKEG